MTHNSIDTRHIDIAKIIDESDSPTLRRLPGCIVALIEKIIRQDEMNRIINKYSGHVGPDFLEKMVHELNLKLVVEGRENLPENGKCFFAANHPFGILDGLVLTRLVSEKYGTLKAIANDAFMYVPPLRPLMAAVNVFGRSSKEYVKALDKTYDMEIPITHFPAGEVSRLHHGKVQDSEWQKSFISKAVSSRRDIVPIYFYGRNSYLFYAVYLLRRLFGISANIELVLLPRELFKKRGKTIKVRIGKPLSYSLFDASSSHRVWAQKVRARVYALDGTKARSRPGLAGIVSFFRERAFRSWYWYVNTVDRNAEILFMNFGYSAKPTGPEQTAAETPTVGPDDPDRYSIQLYHHLASAVDIRGKDIVEIGCGRGGGLSYVTQHFFPASARGVDLDRQAVSFCRRHFTLAGMSFLQGDAQNLNLENGCCDVVLNVESSHRYPDVSAFLGEVRRILRPRGYFLFTDFRYWHEMDGLNEELSQCGMRVLREKTINDEVIAALQLDDERRRRLVKKLAPAFLRGTALNFAGTIGSETYNRFVSRTYIYFSYVMQKP